MGFRSVFINQYISKMSVCFLTPNSLAITVEKKQRVSPVLYTLLLLHPYNSILFFHFVIDVMLTAKLIGSSPLK